MTVTLYDAAYPDPSVDPTKDGCLVYIGGDTPHVWTDAEIAAAHGRYRLPTYVRSNPQNADPVGNAMQAVAWLQAHGVPSGRVVVLDLETAIDAVYVLAFGNTMHAHGYLVWVYGSKSTLFKNPALDGYFVADYTQAEHQVAAAIATQWADGPAYDLDDTNAVAALWDYRPPAPVAAVTPPPDEEEDIMEVWNDGTSEYLWAGGWLTVIHDPAAGSALAAPTNPAGFTATAVPYRKVPADFTAALLASQAARTTVNVPAPVVNVPAPQVTVESPLSTVASFPKTATVTFNS